VRVFEDQETFAFANPAAIVGPGAQIGRDGAPFNSLLQGGLTLFPRLVAVIGAEGALAGYTAFAEWRDPDCAPPKDRDFAFALGPLLVTPDELEPEGIEAVVRVDDAERLRGQFQGFDWLAARDRAAAGTTLRPGDLLAGPALGEVDVSAGGAVEIELSGLGILEQPVVP
jgi:2-keto-4-pentenoate hydratase/2-oxohepta-3-ene-1,7-dioic acid hydratase in catechol pathway